MVDPNQALGRPAWWAHDRVLLRRKILAIAPQFQIFDELGGSLLYCHQKLFKLKEDIRVYSDATKAHEILRIRGRQIIDFSAAYDVVDAQADQKVGALRRRGWKSIVKDEWDILDAADQPIGKVLEEGPALLRRFISFIPQRYGFYVNNLRLGGLRQFFNPFVFKAEMDLSADPQRCFDRRLAMAAGLLLLAIYGRQRDGFSLGV